ncbi:MAG TPA: aspartate-semialdehyde dehydrogenase [Deltaproteobacteria bacterium]|nr:aspartate-semialdehyde dehydrogenase [Deltaproteobacteria bacterium]
MTSGYTVAIAGAACTAGTELVKILEERAFPVDKLIPLDIRKFLGHDVEFNDEHIPVRVIEESSFKGVDIAFFVSGDDISREFASAAVSYGSVVIDSSSVFRMDENVPLIIPEINPNKIFQHKGIIANPGCLTIQMVLPLFAVHLKARIKRIIISTYQAVSDRGQKAMDELTDQIRNLYSFHEVIPEVYPHQIAFNALPHVDKFCDNGYTDQEMSLINETKKIFEDDTVLISATSVQIPVFYSHSQSVNIETARRITPDEVRGLLRETPGVVVEDDPLQNVYPLPIYATGRDECFVGRIRRDLSVNNGIAMWIVSDNIRKGTALNAVQIAERLISH